MRLLSGVSLVALLGVLNTPCGAIKVEAECSSGTPKIRKVSEAMSVHGIKQTGITFSESATDRDQGTHLRIRREELKTTALNHVTDLRVVGDDLEWHPETNNYTFKRDVDDKDVQSLPFKSLRSLETILTTPQALKCVMDKAQGQTQLFLEVRHMVTSKTLKQWKPIADISSLHRLGLKVESVDIAIALLSRWAETLAQRQQGCEAGSPLQLILFIDEYVNALRQETQHAEKLQTFDTLVKNFGPHLHVFSQNDIAPGYAGPEKLFVDGNSHTPALIGVGTEGAGMRTPLGGISVSAFPRVLPLLVNPIKPAEVTWTLFTNECRLHQVSQTLVSDFDEMARLLGDSPAFSTMNEADRLEAQLLLFDQPEVGHRAHLTKVSEFLKRNPLQDIDMIVDHASLPLRTLKVFTEIDPSQWHSVVVQASRLFGHRVTVAHRLDLVKELAKSHSELARTLLVDDVLRILEEGMDIGLWNQARLLFGSKLTPHAFHKLTPSGYGRFLLDICELMSRLPVETRNGTAPSLVFSLYKYHKRDAGLFGRLSDGWMKTLIETGELPVPNPQN